MMKTVEVERLPKLLAEFENLTAADDFEGVIPLIQRLCLVVPFPTDIEDDLLSRMQAQWGHDIADQSYDHLSAARTRWAAKFRLEELSARLAAVKPKAKPLISAGVMDKLRAIADERKEYSQEEEETETVVAEPARVEVISDDDEVISDDPLDQVFTERPKLALSLPGIAGEIQDYYLRTAMQPSEIMSIGVGLMVSTVLVSGNVVGPSGPKGCALQQTLVIVAPTSSGKQWAIDVTKDCVENSGSKALLGPNRFKSGSALIRWVKTNRVSLCVQDEFGRLLAKLSNPKSNPCEVEINDRMREFWALGPESIYHSPIGAAKDDDSERIKDPRLSIFGFGVPDEFFEACKDTDIINGFLNRITVLEETQMMRPRTDFDAAEFPFALMANLGKLHSIKPRRLGWTVRARELYEAELDRVHFETDERKRKLWARTPEKVIRTASTITASRLGKVVEVSDIELAQKIMRLSDEVFKRGIDEAERKRLLDHAQLKIEIERRVTADFENSEASKAEIKRSFRHNTKFKNAVDDALDDMVASGIFEKATLKTGGKPKEVYRRPKEAKK